MAQTLFEMKENLHTLVSEMNSINEWIAAKAADPTVKMEEIREKEGKASELAERIALLEKTMSAEEDKQRKQLAMKEGGGEGTGMTKAEAKQKAKADFYRAVFTGGDVRKAYEGLGALPANNSDLGYGDKLLPKNMSNQLITEPVEVNPLRGIAKVTNITGYSEPKLGFTIEDADLGDVTDKQTAKEIELTGDTVEYGRHKAKVKATVKDTVLHGADAELVGTIETNLSAALAKREKMFAFLTVSDTTHDHMSFYLNQIQEISGANMFDAITKAYADLADDFAANAKVVMRKSDYFQMIQTLANGSEALFTSKPQSILGMPVVFCDAASKPIVGDFSYYGINYDIGTIYDTDKDVDKGEYKFVLTAWGDQQIRLKSAFRIAKVGE